MSARSVEVVVLCEDRQQECFIRRFLQRRGRDHYDFRSLVSPTGRGSGEQWVRERFPRELKAYRTQIARRNTWLIVATTDADTQTVERRIDSFAQACHDAGIPFRKENERVMFVVPKRNIETWFAYLRAEKVNEEDTYPKYGFESDCRQDVERLDENCRQQRLPPEPPPSLESACKEFKRIAT